VRKELSRECQKKKKKKKKKKQVWIDDGIKQSPIGEILLELFFRKNYKRRAVRSTEQVLPKCPNMSRSQDLSPVYGAEGGCELLVRSAGWNRYMQKADIKVFLQLIRG
jgi:hypothetical protein